MKPSAIFFSLTKFIEIKKAKLTNNATRVSLEAVNAIKNRTIILKKGFSNKFMTKSGKLGLAKLPYNIKNNVKNAEKAGVFIKFENCVKVCSISLIVILYYWIIYSISS